MRKLSALGFIISLGLPTLAHAYPLPFPTRGDALADDVYITSSGHINTTNAIDMSALRWDASANQWSAWKSGTTGSVVEDHVAFGTPLYAVEDGYVLSCHRNTADSSDPTASSCPNDVCPAGVTAGGNFMIIVSPDDDHSITYLHLEYDSIPEELCPNVSDGVYGEKTCDLPDMEGYYSDTRLDLESVNPGGVLPFVRKGDYIGNLGHSGRSGGPHLHIHVKPFAWDENNNPCEGPSMPIEWYESWIQPRTPGIAPASDWTPMQGHELVDGVLVAIWPDPIGLESSDFNYGLLASDLETTTHVTGEVMAYRTAAGNLSLRAYTVDSDGVLTNQGVRNEGSVVDHALVRPDTSRNVISAIHGSNGNLKLIPYTVSAAGVITRQFGKEFNEGAIGPLIEATPSPAHDGVVVAIEDGAGDLKVIDYHTTAALDISRNYSGAGVGGAIEGLAIATTMTSFDGVVTAELVEGTGQLIVRSFSVPAAGGVFAADVYSTGLVGTAIDVDTVPVLLGFGEIVVTSTRLATGSMRLDSWSVDGSGQLTPVDSASTGLIGAHGAGVVGFSDLVTGVEDSYGNLRLIGWEVTSAGELRRVATRSFDAINEVAVHGSFVTSDQLLATIIDGSGELHVMSLSEDFVPGV